MHSSYLKQVYNPKLLKAAVRRIGKMIRQIQKTQRIDAIAFRGLSGAGIAFPLSERFGLPLIGVRKGESSHGSHIESANSNIETYIIVDDLICLGGTINEIVSSISASYGIFRTPKCVGVILYEDHYDSKFITGSGEEFPVYNATLHR